MGRQHGGAGRQQRGLGEPDAGAARDERGQVRGQIVTARAEAHHPPERGHAPGPGGHMRIVHTACRNTSTSADMCSYCGGPMRSGSTAWARPWRSPELTQLQPR